MLFLLLLAVLKVGRIAQFLSRAGKSAVRALDRIGYENVTETSITPSGRRSLRQGAAVQTINQSSLGWTVVLRRRPVRIVEGQVQGGYTDAFEIICCDCGDHPDLDYQDASLELQRIRGPYPIAAGITAYQEHLKQYHGQQPARRLGRPVHDAGSGSACVRG